MKGMRIVSMVVLGLMLAELAQAAESYHVLKIKSWDKDVDYEVMSDTDFKKLVKEQQNQAKHASKAADLAKAAWQRDESTKGKPFPQKVLAQPVYTKVGTFSNQEQADQRLTRLLDKEREAQKGKKKSTGKGKPKADPREAEAASRQKAARALFEAKLGEVTAPAAKQD